MGYVSELPIGISFVGKAWGEKKRRAREWAEKAARRRGTAAGERETLTHRLPAWVEEKDGRLVLIPERAAVVKYIYQLAAAGYGAARIVKRLTEEGVQPFGACETYTDPQTEKKRRRAAPVQVLQQLVQMQDDVLLLRHRRLIAVEAIDRDDANPFAIDAGAHLMGELAGRQFRGIDLLDEQLAGIAHRREVDAELLGAREQKPQLLVEDEQGGPLSGRNRSGDVLQHQQRFADAGGPDNERARPGRKAAAEKIVQR